METDEVIGSVLPRIAATMAARAREVGLDRVREEPDLSLASRGEIAGAFPDSRSLRITSFPSQVGIRRQAVWTSWSAEATEGFDLHSS